MGQCAEGKQEPNTQTGPKELGLSREEAKKLYLILKAVSEDLLSYAEEEWELDYYDEKLVDKRGLKKILSKLKAMLPKRAAAELDKLVLGRKYSRFQDNISDKVYYTIQKAFENKNTLRMEYFSTDKGEAVKREVDIYYKNSKYLVAFCHLRGTMRKFRISRIVKCKLTDKKYKIPENFNRKDFL